MRALGWLPVVLLLGCQAFVNTDPGAGIGAACSKDRDCQGARCQDELCVLDCGSQEDCPEGTQCLGALCQLPLRAAFVWVGDPATEEWTRSHEVGRQAIAGQLSFLAETKVFPKVANAAGAATAIDQAVAEGFDVVFANSLNFSTTMQERAAAHEDVDFFTCAGRQLAGNHSSYFGRMYKAWYLAGKAAAIKNTGPARLGMVASYVTPTVVQHVNAFTLGARSVDAATVVEVRWLDFWHDPDPGAPVQEEVLTTALVDSGCQVIGHQADNGVVVQAVESLGTSALSIGNNAADSCTIGDTRCMGAAYWNWAPLYGSILRDVHRGAAPEYANILGDIEVSAAESVVNFDAKEAEIDVELATELAALAAEDGVGKVFSGPFAFNDGTTVDAGVTLEDDFLGTMCQFVEGVVEKSVLTDPTSADQPALVPVKDDCVAPMN